MRQRGLLAGALLALGGCDQLVSPSRYTSVVVEVTQRDGTPVPGVPATLYTGQRPMGFERTNEAGRAVFEHVPEGPAYGVFIQAPDGYAFPEWLLGGPPSDVIAGFPLRADSVPVFRFTLLKVSAGEVTVLVTDDAGAPVPGNPVDLYSTQALVGSATTDNVGTARFADVPYGLYAVQVERTVGFRDAGESAWLVKDGVVVDGGSKVTVGATLNRCQGALGVRVGDPAYGPAPGLLVYLYDRHRLRDSLRTDAAGTARFGVGCGEVGVRVVAGTGWALVPGRGSEYVDGLLVTRGATTQASLTVQYETCRWQLTARVTDDAGAAVGGATLDLYTGAGLVETRSAPDGIATFAELPCSTEFGVRITSPPGWTVPAGRGFQFFDGLRGTDGQSSTIQFVLRRS